MEREHYMIVSFLAKIAGVKEETIWRNVSELRAMIGDETPERVS